MKLPKTEEYRPHIDECLTTFFEDSIRQASMIDPSYQRLWETLHTLISSGGKRLRPKMVIMAYQAFGGHDTQSIIKIAAAHELLHFCLLIHDDIIDRDYTRYGVANIAGSYKDTYLAYTRSPEDQTHYAQSAAILGGDVMLSGAYQLINESTVSDDKKIIAQHYLGKGLFEVAGGELLDTELAFMPKKDGDALKVAHYKTASYSFVSPLLTGAVLAGASQQALDLVTEFAQSLGVAYQLVDDILGVFGDEKETGKSTVSDIAEGKQTYMIEKALGVMSSSDKDLFLSIFGTPHATPSQIQTAKDILVRHNAEVLCRAKIAEYTERATNVIQALNLPDEHREKFMTMITRVTDRAF